MVSLNVMGQLYELSELALNSQCFTEKWLIGHLLKVTAKECAIHIFAPSFTMFQVKLTASGIAIGLKARHVSNLRLQLLLDFSVIASPSYGYFNC